MFTFNVPPFLEDVLFYVCIMWEAKWYDAPYVANSIQAFYSSGWHWIRRRCQHSNSELGVELIWPIEISASHVNTQMLPTSIVAKRGWLRWHMFRGYVTSMNVCSRIMRHQQIVQVIILIQWKWIDVLLSVKCRTPTLNKRLPLTATRSILRMVTTHRKKTVHWIGFLSFSDILHSDRIWFKV